MMKREIGRNAYTILIYIDKASFLFYYGYSFATKLLWVPTLKCRYITKLQSKIRIIYTATAKNTDFGL